MLEHNEKVSVISVDDSIEKVTESEPRQEQSPRRKFLRKVLATCSLVGFKSIIGFSAQEPKRRDDCPDGHCWVTVEEEFFPGDQNEPILRRIEENWQRIKQSPYGKQILEWYNDSKTAAVRTIMTNRSAYASAKNVAQVTRRLLGLGKERMKREDVAAIKSLLSHIERVTAQRHIRTAAKSRELLNVSVGLTAEEIIAKIISM